MVDNDTRCEWTFDGRYLGAKGDRMKKSKKAAAKARAKRAPRSKRTGRFLKR